MSVKPYLQPEFWDWVEKHKGENAAKLRLASPPKDIDINAAVIQVDCRNRFRKKLEQTLTDFPEFYFPSSLAGEQATGDILATFHQRYVSSQDTLVDLTSGLGIDVLHLARVVKSATAIERNIELCEALRYNADGLGISLKVLSGDCRELVETVTGTVAFIDPGRRGRDGRRIFALSDCEPDVSELLGRISANFNRLIIKASPMAGVSEVLKSLGGVTDIYALGTATECKELDLLVDFGVTAGRAARIHAVTVFPDGKSSEFSFTLAEEAEAEAIIARRRPSTDDVLYVPYPSTMKAAPSKLLSSRFNLEKFHNNTHLYFGDSGSRVWDFPGECLEIVDVIPWQSKNLKRFRSRYPHVSVSVRNFGMSADDLGRKLGVSERGTGNLRLFGIGLGHDHTDRILLVCRPLGS